MNSLSFPLFENVLISTFIPEGYFCQIQVSGLTGEKSTIILIVYPL